MFPDQFSRGAGWCCDGANREIMLPATMAPEDFRKSRLFMVLVDPRRSTRIVVARKERQQGSEELFLRGQRPAYSWLFTARHLVLCCGKFIARWQAQQLEPQFAGVPIDCRMQQHGRPYRSCEAHDDREDQSDERGLGHLRDAEIHVTGAEAQGGKKDRCYRTHPGCQTPGEKAAVEDLLAKSRGCRDDPEKPMLAFCMRHQRFRVFHCLAHTCAAVGAREQGATLPYQQADQQYTVAKPQTEVQRGVARQAQIQKSSARCGPIRKQEDRGSPFAGDEVAIVVASRVLRAGCEFGAITRPAPLPLHEWNRKQKSKQHMVDKCVMEHRVPVLEGQQGITGDGWI